MAEPISMNKSGIEPQQGSIENPGIDKYGLLLTPGIKLHRNWFRQMCTLIGIKVKYYSARPGKTWTTYDEWEANFNEPIVIGCIFDEHPNQRTMKKMHWVSELQENESVIHLSYDTPNIQVGNIVEFPSGIDEDHGRLFRITELSNIMVYPASISCKCVPEYVDNYDKALYDHTNNSFNLLDEEGDGNLL